MDYEEITLDDIIETAKNIDLLVVIGIGGSYMGAKALVNMFSNPFTPSKVVFAGYTLDSHYLNQLKEYIKDKNVVLNVISKSGTTLEIKKTYEILKEELKKKYSKEELKDHIIITTDKVNGELRKEVEKEGYKSFIIPDNIGGRYSCLTPVGLLPMAVASIDIKRLLSILNRIVENGDTVLVIEHNLDVIKSSDYIIDLGPDGGTNGGTIVATGTPESVSKVKESYTGEFLNRILK